jgi:hypothetical protein
MDSSAPPPIGSEQMPHSMRPVSGFREERLPVRPQPLLLLGARGGKEVEGVEACRTKDV